MENGNKVTKGTIARTIILVLALVNQILTITGHSPLPISDEAVSELTASIITIIVALINWWKNNSFTKEAIQGDKVMHALKEEAKLQNGQ